ncbi:dTDP-3-amino-3,4,6-trideoxy-alpha-D-glucose transaminase [bacterium HR39]|nr:dTDP-3-amino-3,4,6-trideoxy-alpha-D-glucose transaminase [bacterium HR39]
MSRWPYFAEDEIEAAVRVLRSGRVNYWTGEEGRAFEREFAAFAGTRHAVALSNGTVALELALRALGVGPGDRVVVTPRSFFASAAAVVAVGAEPVFADVDRDSQNITARSVERVLDSRTRAVICVHLAGWPCEMEELLELARARGLFVLEDCAQAHGARVRGRSVGSFGDLAAWSFCQDKIVTTGGEGGMVTTDDEALFRRVWSLKDHGKDFDLAHSPPQRPGFRWLHASFGTNARMTEMQAAIGRRQLAKLPEWHARRARNAALYRAALGDLATVRIPWPPEHLTHAFYKFYLFVVPEALAAGWSRDRILAEAGEAGVPVFSGSCPEIYLERAFEGTPWRPGERLPVARELGETSLMLEVHPTLDEEEVLRRADLLRGILRRAQR